MSHIEGCATATCNRHQSDVLRRPHLRVQLSPPGQPWAMFRFCDLICLQQWLDAEADSTAPMVFTDESWIDSHER